MSTYILGGGIAGLITAFYLKDCKVISPEFGDQMASHFPLGPRYLESSKNSKKFLKDIGLPVEEFEIQVGYWRGSYIQPNQNFREEYYKKSRGQDTLAGFNSTSMNSGKTKMTVLNVDFDKVIEKLVEKIGKNRLIKGKVKSIDPEMKCLVVEKEEGIESDVLDYDYLFSTIPLSFLNKAVGFNETYGSKPVTYCLLKKQILDKLQIAKTQFDFIYCLGDFSFHRITQDKRFPDQIVVDIFGAHEKEELKERFGEDYIDSNILWNAQLDESNAKWIEENVMVLVNYGIICIGRFGTHNRRWKTETVIDWALAQKDVMKNENSSS